ncbi:expressed unknown protein (Partial), partial [Seminavis robusta]|eukprot:Sro1672_g290110.1 n/a (1030) ;mRNA; r:2-3173
MTSSDLPGHVVDQNSSHSRSDDHGSSSRQILLVDAQQPQYIPDDHHPPIQQQSLDQVVPVVIPPPFQERPRRHSTCPGDDPLLGRLRPPRRPTVIPTPTDSSTRTESSSCLTTNTNNNNNNNNNNSSHHRRLSKVSLNSTNASTTQQQQQQRTAAKKRRSSLELRKLPVPSVLFSNNHHNNPSECTELHEDDSVVVVSAHVHPIHHHRNNNNHNNKDRPSHATTTRSSGVSAEQHTTPGDDASQRWCCNFSAFLRRTCLNSNFNLRTQMMLSFGVVSACSILLVVLVCIVVSVMCGAQVQQITQQSFSDLIRSKEGTTARYLAEGLTLRLLPLDLVQVLYEATRDRFAGYPTYEDDSKVPFFDMISQTGRYPIRGPPLPLDWHITTTGGNVNATTAQEHVQSRYQWYQQDAPLSTENAVFFMQGACHPNATLGDSTYWQDCSDANNDVSTGGKLTPTTTAQQIYTKSADLAPLLKSLYEFYLDVKEIGIYFFNSGAGAVMVFPHYALNTSTSYQSIGCDWLLAPHPYDRSRRIGSLQDHVRCESSGVHVDGTVVSTRLYSPMDRAWCRNQAMRPDDIISYGPYQSAWHERDWLMSIGRPVYDRVTKEFIGCISIDYGLDAVEQAVNEGKVTGNSQVTLVRFDEDGTVVASSAWNSTASSHTVHVDELNVGVSKESFARLKELVDYDGSSSSQWNSYDVRQEYENFHVEADGYLVSAYPIPHPPEEYDPSYRPEFFAISSLSKSDIAWEVEDVSESVSETVSGLVSLSLIVGLAGLAAVVLFIFVVSHAITLPLKYMNDVSSDIVNTFGGHKEDGIEMSHTTLDSKCTPKTELNDVVKQFQKIVARFSGSAMARTMQVHVNEIDNQLSLEGNYADLYLGRDSADFRYTFKSRNRSLSKTMEEEKLSKKTAEDKFSKKMEEYKEKDQPDDDSPEKVLQRIHFGSVINDGNKSEATTFRTADGKWGNGNSLTSPLFFWIVALIVLPLLITTVSLSTFVTYSISQGLFGIIQETQYAHIEINDYALLVQAESRA